MKYECESRCFNYPLKCSECKATSDIYNPNPCFLDRNSDLVKRIRVEAIKEFAERLKEKAPIIEGLYHKTIKPISCATIDNLVKEMVGEDK